jgi:hypothetical protein
MLTLDRFKYETVWNDFYNKFCFRPSVDAFPGIEEPHDSITFRLADEYDEAMLDELKSSILSSLKICNAFTEEVYFLDWQHESFQLFESKIEEIWVNGFPNGDYAIFLANQMCMGTFGHPWENSICLFGRHFVQEVLNNKPRILDSVIRNRGCYLI